MASKQEEAGALTDDFNGDPPPYPGGYGYPVQTQSFGYPTQQPPPQYGQSMMGYGQPQLQYVQQGQPMITHPPGGYPPQQVIIVRPAPLANPPSDHLVFNIIMTLCCCWPIGIFAIAKSLECRTAIHSGDRQRAENLSRSARRLGMWTLGAGIAAGVILVIIIVVTFIVLPTHHVNGYE